MQNASQLALLTLLPLEHKLGGAILAVGVLECALAPLLTITRYARFIVHHFERARLFNLELHGVLALRLLLEPLQGHLLAYLGAMQVDRGEISRRLVLILLNVEHERVRELISIELSVLTQFGRGAYALV